MGSFIDDDYNRRLNFWGYSWVGVNKMNDFTKEELEYFLMVMKPFHFLWRHDPLELEGKIQSMIDSYDSKKPSLAELHKDE